MEPLVYSEYLNTGISNDKNILDVQSLFPDCYFDLQFEYQINIQQRILT